MSSCCGSNLSVIQDIPSKTLNGHSTPAVHTVFVAGVTLIYCMWLARNFDDQRRKKLGDASKHTRPLISASLFSTMDDLRACSVCLYVMTERSNFARTFRDTFDQLMNATVGNLIERCGPDSSELIFMASSVAKRTEPKNINDEANKAISSGVLFMILTPQMQLIYPIQTIKIYLIMAVCRLLWLEYLVKDKLKSTPVLWKIHKWIWLNKRNSRRSKVF